MADILERIGDGEEKALLLARVHADRGGERDGTRQRIADNRAGERAVHRGGVEDRNPDRGGRPERPSGSVSSGVKPEVGDP